MTLSSRGNRGPSRRDPHYRDIYEVNFDPVIGHEIAKRRPALVVSNDLNNCYAGTVTVLPITSSARSRTYPFEVHVPQGVGGLARPSRIKADQIRTVDKARLLRRLGALPPEYTALVNRAVGVHLNLVDVGEA